MISRILRLTAAALLLLVGAGAHAATASVAYDYTTKIVVSPTGFWTSNTVSGTGYSWSVVSNRLALTLDANLLDLVDGSLTGSKVGTGINGDNITTGTVVDARIDSAIARDSEVTAAIAALSTVYQPLDADLTDLADGSLSGSKVGTGINGDNVTTGTIADARIAATIARLASPQFTGTPLVNNTNLMAYIASMAGSGGGNANTNASTGWADSTSVSFYDLAIRHQLTIDSISAQSLLLATPLGLASGGTGGTNVATAQAALQLTPGTYTQAYNAVLQQLANLSLQSGDLLYYDGSQVQRLAKATNNQVLTLISGFPAWRDAVGSTNSTTNATAFVALPDVSINTNLLRRSDVAGWNGSNKWVRIRPPSTLNNSGTYEEFFSGCTTTASQSPYASTVINSGSGNANAGSIFGRSGYIRLTTAGSSAALNTGASWMTGTTHLYATNELFFHSELRGAQTNGAAGRIGFFDQNSTNVFNHAFGFTVTNNVWKLIAGLNGNFTLSGTSFVPDTNYWHSVDIGLTNQVGTVQVYTNGVLAFTDSISSTNVPSGVLLGCGVNFFGIAAASTNAQDLVIINDVGHSYSKY